MKIIKTIFLVIILFNAVYPCADIHDVGFKNIQEISLNVSYPETEAEDDACSPLCSCECCSVAPTVEIKPIFISLSVELPGNLIYTQGTPVSSSSLIFQPPKYHI